MVDDERRFRPHHRPSPCCDAPRRRSEAYDAYYCTVCGTWLEVKCSDPGCRYCTERPERAEVTP